MVQGTGLCPRCSYRAAARRFLGFAIDPDHKKTISGSQRLLIIPLWFPTGLALVELLWAWRRKRWFELARRGGFEVQQGTPAAERPETRPSAQLLRGYFNPCGP